MHQGVRILILIGSTILVLVCLWLFFRSDVTDRQQANNNGGEHTDPSSRRGGGGDSSGDGMIEIRRSDPAKYVGQVFSDDFKIPAVIRAELDLSAQEVFDIERELEQTRMTFVERLHQRAETVSADPADTRFFIPSDSEFGSTLQKEFADAVSELLGGGSIAERFREKIAQDGKFASWGKYETHIKIIDPRASGNNGPIRAQIEELDPETGEIVRKVEGGLEFIDRRYGIKFEVEASSGQR